MVLASSSGGGSGGAGGGVASSMHAPSSSDKSLVARPNDFDGSEATYPSWKRQVRIYTFANATRAPDDNDKVMLAASYMKTGRAHRWVIPYVDAILDGKIFTPPLTIARFWQLADQVFLPPALQANAAISLDRLVQGNLTAEAYFVEFDIFATQAGYEAVEFDTMKIRTANKNLKQALVANIHNTETLPTTWNKYKERAVNLDNNWRISRSARMDVSSPSSSSTRQKSNNPFRPYAQPHQPYVAPARDPNAMDVDRLRTAAQEVKAAPNPASTPLAAVTRIEGDRQALFRAGACFYCKTPGHMKAQCPILAAKNTFGSSPRPFTPQTRPFTRQMQMNMDLPSYVPSSVVSSSPPPSVFVDDGSSHASSGFVAGRE
jgi:hypothetical protein